MYNFKPEYFSDYEQLSRAASSLIAERISSCDTIQIGVATGHSPLKTYKLVGDRLRSVPSFRDRIQLFQLDEWMGISANNNHLCQKYIVEHITNPWQIDPNKCFFLEGDGIDQLDQIERMRKHLHKRPIDLCILGLGENGHLALNEPGSIKSDPSRIVDLSEISQSHSMLEGQADKTDKGITIGLKEILESKEVLLLVTGSNKEGVTKQLLMSRIISGLPASVLFEHPNWHCYIDKNVLI